MSEKLCRALGGDNHVVFAAQAEFTRNINSRLIRKGHARLENGLAASNQIGVLVAVEANAVAQAVGEELVVGAIAGAGDDRAGCIVHGAREASGASRVERSVGLLARGSEASA